MKQILFLIAFALHGCVAYAAAPGTGAFNQNQFATNNNAIAIKPGVLLTNAVTKGVSIDASVTEVPATTITASGGIITVSFTNAALYNHTLSADVELAISDTGSATNRLIYLDLYTDGVSSVTWPVGAVLPATTNQPFFSGVGGKVSVLIERAQAPGGGITNYISWTPALIGQSDLEPASQIWHTSPFGYVSTNSHSSGRWTLYPTNSDGGSSLSLEIIDGSSFFSMNTVAPTTGTLIQSIYGYANGTNPVQALYFGVGSQIDLLLDPSQDFGTTPYIFNARLAIGSGNLMEVKNATTNKFVLDYLGNLTIPATLTAQTVAATAITKDGADVATYRGITNVLTLALSDMTTALTTGTNKNYWYAPPEGMTIKWVRATLATASSSGTPTFDINEAGTSILSTKITIDADEFDSLNAATPPVISDSAIAGKAKVDFDIDVAGTAAAGAQIQIGFTVP